MYADKDTPIQISKDKKFARVRRYDDNNSYWWEVINIASISAISEHRIGKQTYSNVSGKRVGYDVYVAGGEYPIWIIDQEFLVLAELLGFQTKGKK